MIPNETPGDNLFLIAALWKSIQHFIYTQRGKTFVSHHGTVISR